ncbi:MAG TPA: CpXC domain-containing protein, partial [Kouleothrix sp.]|nr:CpXC domain-containing protein [Kouleothrix sp.]
MAISRSETIRLRCPSCSAAFEAVAWALVDAAERPDLAAALRDGTLNLAECPRCGAVAPAGAALLFHDPASRRVYFAVPPDTGEHRWREQAQALLYELVGALPEDDRLPYLGDVQVEQELGGVRRAVLRRE